MKSYKLMTLVLIAASLFFPGCNDEETASDINIEFQSAVETGGTSGTADSTGLTLTFDVEPTTVTADNITVTGATKGALTGSGTTRSLVISDLTVANGATVSVAITSPAGYAINGSPKTAVVYRKEYTVTLNKQSGTGGTDSVKATNGSAMPAATAPANPGYIFTGYWDATSGGTQYYNADMSSARNWDKAANPALYARWSTDSYTITYHLNGGDNPGNPASYSVETPTITLLAPTRTNYTFNGWYDNSGFTGSAVTTIPNGSTGDKEFWAKWTANPYTVTYSSTGHTAGTVPSNQTQGYDTTITVGNGNLRGAVIITGKIWQRFTGWNTESNGSGTAYQPGATFTLTGNITLYAQYTTGTDVLRKTGPAGGLVFYVAGSPQSWGQYLECAPQSTEWTLKVWGGYSTPVDGANGTAIGTGEQNTNDIVTQLGDTEPYKGKTDYAAKLCNNLTYIYNGTTYDDWFLPSRYELYEMCGVLHSRKRDGTNTVINNPDYGTDRVGGFMDEVYWSSSERDGISAWRNGFGSCDEYNTGKQFEFCVRAIRAF